MRYGDPLWANCTASTQQVQGMGWESSQGGTPLTGGVTAVPLDIPSVTDWGLSPVCYINTLDGKQCKETLQVIVYSKFSNRFLVLSHLLLMVMKLPKYCDTSCSPPPTEMPDKVLISGHDNPLVQDRNYEMRCDVLNVAPVKNLFLHWYKGNTLINISVFNEPAAHPVNASAAITLLADGGDHGRSILCEAVMYFSRHGAKRLASRSQAYKMEVLCMFLNAVLSSKFRPRLPFFFTRLTVFQSFLVSPQFLQPSPTAQRRSWSCQMEVHCFSTAQLRETRPRRTAGASRTPSN